MHNSEMHATNGNSCLRTKLSIVKPGHAGTYHTQASYETSSGPACPYDGMTIASTRRNGKFQCAACGVALSGSGQRPHPTKRVTAQPAEDDISMMGLSTAAVPAAPTLVATVVPPSSAPAATPQKSEPAASASASRPESKPSARSNRGNTPGITCFTCGKPGHKSSNCDKETPPKKDPPVPVPRDSIPPRYQTSPPGPIVNKVKVAELDSDFVLDGRRLTEADAKSFCQWKGIDFLSLETRRLNYSGEQRIATNRNVAELRQDVVVQTIKSTSLMPRMVPVLALCLCITWPIFVYLHDVSKETALLVTTHVPAAAFLLNISATRLAIPPTLFLGLCMMCGVIVRCRSRTSLAIAQRAAMMLLFALSPPLGGCAQIALHCVPFLPHILFWWANSKWGESFQLGGATWHPTRTPFIWLGLIVLGCVLPHELRLLVKLLIVLHFGPKSRDIVYQSLTELLFPDNVKVLWYVPHAASCAISEYSNGTGAEVVVSTCRGKLLRLACLPLPDVMHSALVSGTEEVAKYLVSKEPFFEAGATFATVPL